MTEMKRLNLVEAAVKLIEKSFILTRDGSCIIGEMPVGDEVGKFEIKLPNNDVAKYCEILIDGHRWKSESVPTHVVKDFIIKAYNDWCKNLEQDKVKTIENKALRMMGLV